MSRSRRESDALTLTRTFDVFFLATAFKSQFGTPGRGDQDEVHRGLVAIDPEGESDCLRQTVTRGQGKKHRPVPFPAQSAARLRGLSLILRRATAARDGEWSNYDARRPFANAMSLQPNKADRPAPRSEDPQLVAGGVGHPVLRPRGIHHQLDVGL